MQALARRRRRRWNDEELVGRIVADRYEVRRPIARGATGDVYEARDRNLGRDVALKVLRSSDDPTLVERFRREAQLGARFDHPNIVRLFDFGQLEDGCPFVVMELLRGKLFSRLLGEEGPMAPARVLDLLRGV